MSKLDQSKPVDMQVTCLFDFNGDDDPGNDFVVKAGESLSVVDDKNDPRWLLVKNGRDCVGRIPRHYVKSKNEEDAPKYPWLLEKVSRAESEKMLKDSPCGTYLLRVSEHFPGNYTLSVKGEQTEHYRVMKHASGRYTIDDEKFFPDLLKLIEHYQSDADGICSSLTTPASKLASAGKLASGLDQDSEGQDDQDASLFSINWSLFKEHKFYIHPSCLKLKSMIGEGEYGKVYQGLWLDQGNSHSVAIKSLKSTKNVNVFLREAHVMRTVGSHPNVVQLYGVSNIAGCFSLAMEHMDKGSVLDYLITHGRHVIKPDELLSFAKDTCTALEYLEQSGVVHRDIAASNVLLNKDGTAKLSDFGMSELCASCRSHDVDDVDNVEKPVAKTASTRPTFLSSSASAFTGQSPKKVRVKWASLESLERKVWTSKSDVWSFGIFLWELYSFGRPPYPRIPMAQVLKHLKSGYRMSPPSDCPEIIGSLMKNCWTEDSYERSSFTSILYVLTDMSQ